MHRREKLDILKIDRSGLYDQIWQAFAVLLPVKTVGVMGDGRTYDHVCALRAITSTDGMTADFYPFEPALLGRIGTRIINEVRGINHVVYDYTSKPLGDDRVGVKGIDDRVFHWTIGTPRRRLHRYSAESMICRPIKRRSRPASGSTTVSA